MERILSVAQMRQADEFTINNLGFSSSELIERAGYAVVSVIRSKFLGGRVLVCVGKGNNGEDGKVVANALSKLHGFTVATLNVQNGIFKLFEKKYDIIVDCIFGTGLSRQVEGKYKEAIEKINQSGAFVISCDIASGLNGDTGKAMGVAVKADITVAIQEYKLGHFLNDGLDYSGEIIAKDIGISIWGDDYFKKMSKKDMSRFFIPSLRNVNKGDFNKTLVIGGSKEFSGSALLSFNALTALKMGNGYSYLAVPDCLYSAVVGLNPECIIKSLPSNGNTLVFDELTYANLLDYDSIAFGMGVGVSEEIYKILKYLLKNYKGRLLVDADGLNTLAYYGLDPLKNKACEVALTPHIKEFSRLAKIDKEDLTDNLIEKAKAFATKYKVVLNVKSAVSVITDGEEAVLNVTGANGMAKAGSGDVLSGITAGLLAKGEEVLESVAGGAYLFGKAGEIAQKESCQFTLTATDIIKALPGVINTLI